MHLYYFYHLCRGMQEELQHCHFSGALKCGGCCKECQLDIQALEKCGCQRAAVYELLRTVIVGGPFLHIYGEKGKLTKVVIGYDANSLYLYCSGM